MRATKTTHEGTHDAQHIATNRLAYTFTTTGFIITASTTGQSGYTRTLAAMTCKQQARLSKMHAVHTKGQVQKGYRVHLVKTPSSNTRIIHST
jgi:hypothetical protein